ncbi:type III-B CRISPR module RAMP protein Cmr1 [Methylacidimicrobium tartarophylax]|uniref:CRISPR type III-associated protein domain-containing protein n=1 Tax=Methylacidimicrobium tartarophylax TaxID=1041768 RepID=A0A5E6M808_9BACT|nr:hypothetical protein MAMT_00628 [Methylacidimicrobium tartarophylax]
MSPEPYEFEFLTPCFCGGADPAKAELRASTIRGQLRWWFRALGGSREEEACLFGCIGDSARASCVAVRIVESPDGGDRDWAGWSVGSYIWYFIRSNPQRWQADGALPPGSKAKVEIFFRRSLDSDLEKRWKDAWRAFCRFGAIGYRMTRCAGAFRVSGFDGEREEYEKTANAILKPAGFHFRFFWEEKRDSWRGIVKLAEEKLRDPLRKSFSAMRPSPLGYSSLPSEFRAYYPPRQTSAVYFRPLKLAEKEYYLMLFEAPHKCVVGEEVRRTSSVGSVLEKVFPQP